MPLIYRSVKGSKLSIAEMDGNLEFLSSTLSSSLITVTGSVIDATNTDITASGLYLYNNLVADSITANSFTGSFQGTASYVELVAGPGIVINNLEITASVRTVNGVSPSNGNIAVSFSATVTGTSASLVSSGSGTVTGSIPNGLVWIISNDPTPANNGDVYIYNSGSVGVWYQIAPLDQVAADVRYLKLDGANSPMTGNINMGGFTLIGTSSWAQSSSVAISSSYALTASHALNVNSINTSSFATTGSNIFLGNQIITGSVIISGSSIGTEILKIQGNLNQSKGGIFGGFAEDSHLEGINTYGNNTGAHAEGYLSSASGLYAHAEGYQTHALGNFGSHAEGYQTLALGNASHAEGLTNTASANFSHAEGTVTLASASYSHTEGWATTTKGLGSHAEGFSTLASGITAHSEGASTTASGNYSHAEGSLTRALGSQAHAEGSGTVASGEGSHAEGNATTASGTTSHAEGDRTKALGVNSHSEGQFSVAFGSYSHAEGNSTVASGSYQTVVGSYNLNNNISSSFIVGIGNVGTRKDGFTVDVDINLSGSIMIPTNTANPSSPKTGSMYFNPTTNLLYLYNGTAWRSSSFS